MFKSRVRALFETTDAQQKFSRTFILYLLVSAKVVVSEKRDLHKSRASIFKTRYVTNCSAGK